MTTATGLHHVVPAHARDFLNRQPMGLLIGGEWVAPQDSGTIEVVNPATEERLCDVAVAGRGDVERAVAAARLAFESSWSRSQPRERRRLLHRLADLLEQNAEEFAYLETLDNGKPLSAARSDVGDAVEWFRHFAGAPGRIEGTTPEANAPDMFVYTRREPAGVCALIIPWNYPLVMAAWKLAPALACGCTAILKPAEQTPLTALRLGQLFVEAGFPPGVVNVLPGLGDTAGRALVEHRGVDKVAFTGSTDVAKNIMSGAGASNLKRVSLEAGGKSPNIVFADADLDEAREGAALAIYHNLGQDCTAGSRLFVQRPIFDDIVQSVADAGAKLVVGDGLDPRTEVGPVVSDQQRNRVRQYIELGLEEGGNVIARRSDRLPEKGYFVPPTVLAGMPHTARVCQEEIFGPVVTVLPFSDIEEVVRLANATDFGLGAGIWTRDVGKAHHVASLIRAGTVWVNTYNQVDPAVPFGGFKQSGIGREHGTSSIDLYTELKSVWVKL